MLFPIVIFALTVGVGVFILFPLLNNRHEQVKTVSDTEELILRRDQLFHDIRELEFDYRTGKLNDTDYEQLVGELKSEAAAVIEVLESQQDGQRAKKRTLTRTARNTSDEEIEARIAQARKTRVESSIPCPSCGHRNAATVKFCSECGTSMVSEAKERSS